MNKSYVLKYEIRIKGEKNLFDSETVELASVELYGAIQEANGIIERIKKGYGEAFEVKAYVFKNEELKNL